MVKLVVEFKSLTEVMDWAKKILDDPKRLVGILGVETEPEGGKAVKKSEKVETTETAEKTKVSQLLVDIKEAGVKLTDMQPTRYEGVQLVLGKFGVTKIKDLEEDDQPEVLKMFNKMINADKAGFAQMLEYLKQ